MAVSDFQVFGELIAQKVAKQYTKCEQAIAVTDRPAIIFYILSDLFKLNREK
jgi:hypothetical protein